MFDDKDSFRDYLIQTCRQHKSEGRALAFAFIVYDFGNHTMARILEDRHCWTALDVISGSAITVFYVNSQDSYFKKRQKQIYQDEKRQRDRNSKEGFMSFLVPIAKEPTPTDNAISFIKSAFHLGGNVKTPFVLFFQIDDGGNISDSFVVGLTQDRLEDAFSELKKCINNAVESIKDIRPEYRKNHQEIFELIKWGVERGKLYDSVTKKSPTLGIEAIVSFVGLIAGLK